MKNIFYSLSNFHKAVKRNKPLFVICTYVTSEFFFFTQKACINYAAGDYKDVQSLELWLKNQGIKIEYES